MSTFLTVLELLTVSWHKIDYINFNNCEIRKFNFQWMYSSFRAGLPNLRPRGHMRPPGPFYVAPGPSSKNSWGSRKLLLLFADTTLLYLHRWFPLLRIWTTNTNACVQDFMVGGCVLGTATWSLKLTFNPLVLPTVIYIAFNVYM